MPEEKGGENIKAGKSYDSRQREDDRWRVRRKEKESSEEAEMRKCGRSVFARKIKNEEIKSRLCLRI